MNIKLRIYRRTGPQKNIVAKEARMKQILSKPRISTYPRPCKRRHNHSPIKILPPEKYLETDTHRRLIGK